MKNQALRIVAAASPTCSPFVTPVISLVAASCATMAPIEAMAATLVRMRMKNRPSSLSRARRRIDCVVAL